MDELGELCQFRANHGLRCHAVPTMLALIPYGVVAQTQTMLLEIPYARMDNSQFGSVRTPVWYVVTHSNSALTFFFCSFCWAPKMMVADGGAAVPIGVNHESGDQLLLIALFTRCLRVASESFSHLSCPRLSRLSFIFPVAVVITLRSSSSILRTKKLKADRWHSSDIDPWFHSISDTDVVKSLLFPCREVKLTYLCFRYLVLC